MGIVRVINVETSANQLSTTVLINCYNYAEYVGKTIDSALKQNHRPDQIIAVDDGSTDGSYSEMVAALKGVENSKVIKQENEGQLGCIQKGVSEATGDIIFFLDADDLWEKNHISSFLKVYSRHPEVDTVYTGYQEFGHREGKVDSFSRDLLLGKTRLRAAYGGYYFGTITSAIAIRRSKLQGWLPRSASETEDFRISADEVLIRGASISGDIKYYLHGNSVRYQLHGANNYYTTKKGSTARIRQKKRASALTQNLVHEFGLGRNLDLLFEEIETQPVIDRKSYRKFISTSRRMSLPLWHRLRVHSKLLAKYLNQG